MADGFIKLYRQFMEWEWYHDINTKVLFLHCLLKANHKDNKWQGKIVKTGTFVTSYATLAKELSLSVRQIRTSLNHLKSTSELTSKTTNKYTLIEIVKWAKYQSYDSPSDKQNDKPLSKQPTSNRQATDKQPTTNKNEKNIKNEENEENLKEKQVKETARPQKHKYGEFSHVLLKNEEYQKLKTDFGNVDELIKYLDEYIEMKGVSYKSHYMAIRKWVVDAVKEKQGQFIRGHANESDIERRARELKERLGTL